MEQIVNLGDVVKIEVLESTSLIEAKALPFVGMSGSRAKSWQSSQSILFKSQWQNKC